jgi:cell division protein FtsL
MMHVTLAGFVLFLHIGVAISAFMMAGVMHAALQALARAGDVAEMRSWARAVHRLDPLFPLAALMLLGLGSWLIHLSGGEFAWSDGWIITAVTTLVVIEGLSGVLIAPRAKALVHAIDHTPDGRVPDAIRSATTDRALWHVAHMATIGFLGVVFLMAAKPSGGLAVVIAVVATALGVVISEAQLRRLPASAGTTGVPAQRNVSESSAATG